MIPILGCSILALAAGCGPVPVGVAGAAKAQLSLQHLVPIDKRYGHYEAWATVGGKPQSLGKFLVGADGALTDLAGAPKGAAAVAGGASEVYLTQELPDDADAVPSKQVFLRGAVTNGVATLKSPLTEAWNDAKGVYILDNPFTWKDGSDYNGIWFGWYDQASHAYQTGLTIPEAPAGTMYAGWVILKGVPLRVGKFRSATDNDDWGVYSGRTGASELIDPVGKPMPGEDFFTNLPPGVETGTNKPNLGGATVIVSLESAVLTHEDQYPGPVRVLTATVPENPVHMQVYNFANVTRDQVPAGTVTIQ